MTAFRANEASRVATVLEAIRENRPIADALVAFWSVDPERPGPDHAAMEVWAALDSIHLATAVEVALDCMRQGQRIRAHAFLDVVDRVSDVHVLIDLATRALTARWDTDAYLAPVFARLVDEGQERAVLAFIKVHHAALRRDPATWRLVGFTMTSTAVGTAADIDLWLDGWQQREGVPMWLVAAYAGTLIRRSWRRLDEFHAVARDAVRLEPDETAAFFATCVMSQDLAAGRDQAFLARMDEMQPVIEDVLRRTPLEHPITRHWNACRRRHHLTSRDFHTNPRELVVVDVWWAFARRFRAEAPLLVPLAGLLRLERGDPALGAFYRQVDRRAVVAVPWLAKSWRRVVRAKLGFLARMRAISASG